MYRGEEMYSAHTVKVRKPVEGVNECLKPR